MVSRRTSALRLGVGRAALARWGRSAHGCGRLDKPRCRGGAACLTGRPRSGGRGVRRGSPFTRVGLGRSAPDGSPSRQAEVPEACLAERARAGLGAVPEEFTAYTGRPQLAETKSARDASPSRQADVSGVCLAGRARVGLGVVSEGLPWFAVYVVPVGRSRCGWVVAGLGRSRPWLAGDGRQVVRGRPGEPRQRGSWRLVLLAHVVWRVCLAGRRFGGGWLTRGGRPVCLRSFGAWSACVAGVRWLVFFACRTFPRCCLGVPSVLDGTLRGLGCYLRMNGGTSTSSSGSSVTGTARGGRVPPGLGGRGRCCCVLLGGTLALPMGLA